MTGRNMKLAIGITAIAGLVFLSANCSAGETSTTLRIRELQREYTATAQQVNAGREQLLRLEGAISILQQMENESDDRPTTSTPNIPEQLDSNVPD